MQRENKIDRRKVLSLIGWGAAGVLGGMVNSGFPRVRPRLSANSVGSPDLEIALNATKSRVSILPGNPTDVLAYQGTVLGGDQGRMQTLEDTYLGPIIRMRTGERIRVRFTNYLAEETVVHWHGLHVPEAMDGHPRFAIPPGESYVYDFQVLDRAGPYWFHPHPHGRTATQVYHGLAGLFLVSDEEEDAANLPTGEYDVPLVLQDRAFDANNQFAYAPGSLVGFLGDTILVNGRPNFSLPVKRVRYRLRFWNGSNSRIYKLAWEDATPLAVIATDGGLLATPVEREYVTLAPGERVEVLVDFAHWHGGTNLRLQSLGFSGASPSGSVRMRNGAEFRVMTFQIASPKHSSFLPLAANGTTYPNRSGIEDVRRRLSAIERYQTENAVNAGTPRRFDLSMQHMEWTINGRTFEMEGVAPDEIVQLNSQEVWEFINSSMGGMGMMQMAHPMHVHGLQFQVLSRQPPTDRYQRENWETVKDGYVDGGWKDTVLVMPGERVQVQLAFRDYAGLFLYHCHNLEHEDMGMMRNYRVQDTIVTSVT